MRNIISDKSLELLIITISCRDSPHVGRLSDGCVVWKQSSSDQAELHHADVVLLSHTLILLGSLR